MGSVKQISIGIACVVAAFAFGNYMNTHPSGEELNDAAQVVAESGQDAGNVQSRLTSGIELIKKQPAPIATMRNRLEPQFSIPPTSSSPELNSGANRDPLPPPSQLARNESNNPSWSKSRTSMLDKTASIEITPRTAKASDVPDFSAIMNELSDSPIKLQTPSSSMPQYSGSNAGRTAQAIVKPREKTGTPLKDLVSEFKMGTMPRDGDVANPWNTQQQPEFSEEDFSPQLQDRYSNNPTQQTHQPNVLNKEIATATPPDLQPLANQTELSNGRSNHVVSREPIPPKSLADQPENNSSARFSRAETRLAPVNQTARDTVPRTLSPSLPFALNDNGKQQLAAIKSRASSQLELNTTKFVEHVVQQGETLQSISRRYFGSSDYYLDIYLANRNKLRNPVIVESGTALRIPVYKSVAN